METRKNNIEYIPEFEKDFRHPRHWGAWIGVYAFAGLALTPAAFRDPLLGAVGRLAGKLGKDEEGVFGVEYDDDINGVEVVVAEAPETAVADLTDEEGTLKFKELLPYSNILNLEGLHRPLLSLQVTLPNYLHTT